MKNKSLYTTLAYWFLMLGLVLYLSGCRTKKSSIDSNTKEIEKVSIIDKSKNDKKESVQENGQETKTESLNEKQFFESWMSFESDKITITDIHGTKTEIIKPRINNKSSQSNDVSKVEQTDTKTDKASKSEENTQTDIDVLLSKETKTDLQQKQSSKGKEPIWLYIVSTIVFIGFAWYVFKEV